MRVRPVIPMIVRMVNRPWQLGDYVVPAHTPSAVSIVAAAPPRRRLSRPATGSRPERFVGRKPGTYTWIPFGGGIRRCLGATLAMAEQRVVLRAIARRTDLAAPDPAPEPPRQRNVTMIPRSGGRVVVQRKLPADVRQRRPRARYRHACGHPRHAGTRTTARRRAAPRERLIDAMAASIEEKGYRDTTVADVVRIARTSRRTFYEHFEDREACFLALFDATNDATMEQIAAAVNPEEPLDEQVDHALDAYIDSVTSHPALYQSFVRELPGLGRAGADRQPRRDRALRPAADRARRVGSRARSRRSAPGRCRSTPP